MSLFLLYLAPSALVLIAGVVRASRRSDRQPALAVVRVRAARRPRS